VPVVIEGHVVVEDPATSCGDAPTPGITWIDPEGVNPKESDGCTAKLTLAVAVPLLAMGSGKPLFESAT
jgi:hypothetical protein